MPNAESAVAKGGSKDDFSIFSITVGNQSQATEKWIQPDGEVTDYVLQDSTIEVNNDNQRWAYLRYAKTNGRKIGNCTPDRIRY